MEVVPLEKKYLWSDRVFVLLVPGVVYVVRRGHIEEKPLSQN